MANDLNEAKKEYAQLAGYAAARQRELSELLRPYVEVTDEYGVLLTAIALHLGHHKPNGAQQRTVRDLMSDVFDFLVESRRVILQGQLQVAYPLIRRSYESLSLMVLCILDDRYAGKWQSGTEIGNAEVRRELAKHPLGEPEDRTKDLYRFFSKAAHPNRDLVPERFLGDGNEFVLGAIGQPDLVLLLDYCLKHLNLWFWFGACITHWCGKPLAEEYPLIGNAYSSAAKRASDVAKWLTEQFNHLLEEVQASNER